MIKLLDKYIFKALFAPFLFGVFSFFIIMAIDPLYTALNYIIAHKKPTVLVLKWFMYKMLSNDLIFVFPMSILLATLMTMGNFSKLSEIIAMKSGGLSFRRIVIPVLVFAFLVSCFTFLVYEYVVPRAIEREAIYKNEKLLNVPKFITKNNIFLRESENQFLYIKKVNFYNRTFKYMIIYYFDKNKLIKTLGSPKGTILKDKETWILNNGSINYFDDQGLVINVEKFTEKTIKLNNSLKEIEDFDKEDPNALSFFDLYRKIKSLSKHGVLNLNKYLVALYQKTAMPFSCFIFAFIGAVMGTTTKRSGTFTNLGLSVIMIFIYYVLLSFVKSYGIAGKISPIFATWMPNFVFSAFGIYLITKVKN